MYRKVEIFDKAFKKNDKHRIGPDAVKIVNCNNDSQRKNVFSVKGEICDVGLDFVDLLQDNHSIITVMTDRINRIKWDDPRCNDLDCRPHRKNCRYVEFSHHADDSRFLNCRCGKKLIKHDEFSHRHERTGKNRSDECPDCHHHDSCGKRFACFCDHAIPFCDDRIELRLAGLTDQVNFQLFQHKGCKVEFDIS